MSTLPKGWIVAKLGDLCERIVDGSHNPPKATEAGKPMLSARNIFDFKINFDEYRLISESDFELENARTYVSVGDVLLTIVGSIGRTAVVPTQVQKFALQRSVAVLKPSIINSHYIAYALSSPESQRWLQDNAKGTAQKGVYLKTLGTMPISVAPELEQTRIVTKLEELLTNLDTGVAELKMAQKKLVQYRQSLLKAAVEGALTAQWRENNPATESGAHLLDRILFARRTRWEAKKLAKFAEQGKTPPRDWQKKYPEPVQPDTTNLPQLPEGWVWASVELLGDVQLGRQRSPEKLKGISPTPYIRAANITEAGIDFDDVLEMDFSEQERKVFQLQAGDVLLTEASGSPEHVGRPVIWPDIDRLYCFQNTVLRFKPRHVTAEFAFYSFLAMQKLGVFSKLSGGVGINHLSAGRFSKLPLALPSANEEMAIVNTLKSQLAAVDEKLAATTLALNQSAAQRQKILRVAFAGQLVAQDPNDEPASMLLERIRAQRAVQAKQPKQSKPRKLKKKESTKVTRKLVDVLIEAGDWLPAQEAFRRCGIADGAQTEEIEALYAELRVLDQNKRLLVDVVKDEYGRKVYDRLKWVG